MDFQIKTKSLIRSCKIIKKSEMHVAALCKSRKRKGALPVPLF